MRWIKISSNSEAFDRSVKKYVYWKRYANIDTLLHNHLVTEKIDHVV